MGNNIKLEIIYFRESADIKLEFGLRGEYPLRLLSSRADTIESFLSALKRASLRSSVIITVGGFSKEPSIPEIVSHSVGLDFEPFDFKKYHVDPLNSPTKAPKNAIPLISSSENFAGFVIESGPQSIIMLTEDNRTRLSVLFSLIVPYITDHYKFINNIEESAEKNPPLSNETIEQEPPSAELPLVETPKERAEEEEPKTDNTEKEEAEEDSPSDAKFILDEPETREDFDDIDKFLFDIDFISNVPGNRRRSKSRAPIIVIISILLVIAVAVAGFFSYKFFFKKNLQLDAPENVVVVENGALAHESVLQRLHEFHNVNNDIIGWLSIPQIGIDSPVAAAEFGKGSDYYKTHAFDGSESTDGTPYVYGDFASNQLHRNYVLFGSYDLSKFLSQAFYNEDLIFNFDTINAAEHWKVFSAFKLSTLPFDIKLTSFNDDIEYFSYITNLISSSQVSLDTTISANDPIAILVNEGSDGTTVVAAKMIPEDFSKNNTIELEEPIVSLPEPFDLSSSNLISSIISSLFNPSLPQPESKPTMPSSPVTSATPPPPSDDADDKILTVSNNLNGGERVSGKASDILPMIIEAEMGSHFHIEALKAQAVSAYSWLLNNGSDKNKYPSLPMKTAGARAKEAVNAVLGKTVTFGGRTVSTYFCAMSAGKTASVQDIWGGNAYPYLQSVDSSADIGLPNWETTRTYKASDVSLWLDEMGINNKSENKNEWFKTEYDKNGIYCTYVTIGTERNKGTFLRDKLFTAARVGSSNVLRSSAYRISYNSSQDTFTFVVKGYGHGVGMSQYAARVYADSGWSYEKILKHYFPGVSIE